MSTYSPSLRIELITTGAQAGTWGTTTNTNLGGLIESAIAGYVSVSITSANQALTALNGAPDESRNQTIALTTTTTAAFAVYAPPAEKTYVIYNASAYAATIYNSSVIGNTTAAGTGVVVPAGKTVTIWSDGTNFRTQNDHLASLTLASALPVTSGGTGVTTSTGTGNNVLSNSPTFTGTPAAPTASVSTDTTQIATTAFVQDVAAAVKEALYPVGSIYTNATNSTNPGTLLGFGTWTAFAAGRVAVGFNASNALFDTAEATGGSADAITVSHTHTGTTAASGSASGTLNSGFLSDFGNFTAASGVFSLSESYANRSQGAGGTGSQGLATLTIPTHTHTITTDSSGSSGTNANYQPYITVYMWKRTA
jgi:hypothetical protein